MKENEKEQGLVEVPVSLDDEIIADREAVKALEQATGLVKIDSNHFGKLRKIGGHGKWVGIVRLQHGAAMASQTLLSETQKRLMQEIITLSEDKTAKGRVKNLCMLAHELGFVGKTLTESQRLSAEMEGRVNNVINPGNSLDGPRVKSFAPGQTIVLANDVHMTSGPPQEQLKG